MRVDLLPFVPPICSNPTEAPQGGATSGASPALAWTPAPTPDPEVSSEEPRGDRSSAWSERAARSVDRGPISPDLAPPATPSGAATSVPSSVPRADRALFERIARANELVESGGRGAVESRLVTTAGPGSPASIGRSQLLVSLQVTFLERLEGTAACRAALAAHGVTQEDLRAIDARGDAAVRWYDAIVRGRLSNSVPLSREDLRELREPTADPSTVLARLGEAFERDTGIPAAELAAMLDTRLVLDAANGRRFRVLRSRLRDDTAALDRLVTERPELARVRARMQSDASLSFFLRRPKRNGEHRAAWYTRAARTASDSYARVDAGLRGGLDAMTSRYHAARTFGIARGVFQAIPDAGSVGDARRSAAIARMARLVHGSPAFFRSQFGTADAPRVASVAELEARLRSFASASTTLATGDHGASLRAFDERFAALAERERPPLRPPVDATSSPRG